MAKQILIKDSKLKDLKPDPLNPRTISEEKLSSLRKSLEEFGDLSCIVYNELEDKLVGAHQRIKTWNPNSKIVITDKYKKPNRQGTIREGYVEIEGEKFKYRVVRWTEEKHKAAMLAANKHSGEWDQKKLSEIVESLKQSALDFNLTGFDFSDFPKIFPEEVKKGLVDDDFVPDPKKTDIKLGDVYELGNHRLMCGDSTDKATVEKLLNGEKADITFTSPPYNLGNNAKLRGYNGDGEESAYIEKSDHKTQEEYLNFLIKWTSLAINNSKIVFSNIQLLAGNKFVMSDYWNHFKYHLVDLMIWDKVHAQPSAARRVLNSVFEFIFIFTEEKYPKRSIKTGKDFRGTIQNIYRLNPIGKKDELAKNHGAVFPVQFAEFFVDQFSEKSVLDLFGGSGSTLIACEKTNRKCFMMELDPHYCQVIIDRWEAYTGKKAKKVSK